MEIKNVKLTYDEFYHQQKEVLAGWPTGQAVDFQEAVDYQKKIRPEKRFSEKLRKADRNGQTLVQPRAGVALPENHISLLHYLETDGEADLLPTTIDSYTRHNLYEDAQKGIDESKATGHSLLNGFPAVNHGVAVCREVVEALHQPLQIRHGTPDARLLAEISLAGGFTSFEGGGISYNIPYAKEHSLEFTIKTWQYVDRLVGLYEEAGITINREPFGPLTGTLVPPSISHAVAIVESLLACEQGVKNITVGYGQSGNLIQDVAAIASIRQLTEEYLQKYGYQDVEVTTVLHQWMGGFPQDESKAYGVISWGAAAAALGGATKCITKTPHEAMGVPTKEANAGGLKATKQVVAMLQGQKIPSGKQYDEEYEMICRETRLIVDKIIELGQGDVAVGIVRGFEAGVIDVPFAPSKYNMGAALPARDHNGAVRFMNCGSLPFDEDIKNFHQQKMAERAKAEQRRVSFQMVIDDIYAIGKGWLTGRPKR